MRSSGVTAEDKAIWVFKGDNLIVENIEFSGARSSYGNGGGIRHVGSNLYVRGSYFHDNDVGIMTGNNRPNSETIIEYSEFSSNGPTASQKGQWGHNIYIGRSHSATLRYSYSHHAISGHNF